MGLNRREKSGKVNKCSCGRVILHVETKKNPRKHQQTKKGLRAIASMIKNGSNNNGTSIPTGLGRPVNAKGLASFDITLNGKLFSKQNLCVECEKSQAECGNHEHHHPQTKRDTSTSSCKSSSTSTTVATDSSKSSRSRSSRYKVTSVVIHPASRDFYQMHSKTNSAKVCLSSDKNGISMKKKQPSSGYHYSELTEEGFDGFAPTDILKKTPCRFTFDEVPSAASIDESVTTSGSSKCSVSTCGSTSTADSMKVRVGKFFSRRKESKSQQKMEILPEVSESQMPMSLNHPVSSQSYLTHDFYKPTSYDNISSYTPQTISKPISNMNPPFARNTMESSQTIPPRKVSADAEMSIEFSEADHMRLFATTTQPTMEDDSVDMDTEPIITKRHADIHSEYIEPKSWYQNFKIFPQSGSSSIASQASF